MDAEETDGCDTIKQVKVLYAHMYVYMRAGWQHSVRVRLEMIKCVSDDAFSKKCNS